MKIRYVFFLVTILALAAAPDAADAKIRCGKFGCSPTAEAPALAGSLGAARARKSAWRTVLRERQRTIRAMRAVARERARRQAAEAAAMTATRKAGIPLTELDVSAIPTLRSDGIRKVQQALKNKGFDPGPINGVASPRMKKAVSAFQNRYGIASQGGIDNQTLLALGEADLASQADR